VNALGTPTFKLACLKKNRVHTETTEGTKKRGVYKRQRQVYVFSVYSVYSVRNHHLLF